MDLVAAKNLIDAAKAEHLKYHNIECVKSKVVLQKTIDLYTKLETDLKALGFESIQDAVTQTKGGV